MLDDSIIERKMEDYHFKTHNELEEPEHDGDNVQLNVDQQSYGEKSVTDDSDNVIKNSEQEITKVPEILEQTESIMKETSKESDRQSRINHNNTRRRVTCQQTKIARGMATKNKK